MYFLYQMKLDAYDHFNASTLEMWVSIHILLRLLKRTSAGFYDAVLSTEAQHIYQSSWLFANDVMNMALSQYNNNKLQHNCIRWAKLIENRFWSRADFDLERISGWTDPLSWYTSLNYQILIKWLPVIKFGQSSAHWLILGNACRYTNIVAKPMVNARQFSF